MMKGSKKVDEELLNATEAAIRLGVTTERFRRAVAANHIEPARKVYWRYGRYVSYYRPQDVDSLASWLVADAATRHVEAVAKRPEAARKAAETRRRNLEAKKVARERLDQVLLGASLSDADAIRLVVSLLLAAERGCGRLTPFTHDDGVSELTDLITTARLSEEESKSIFRRYRTQALEAAKWFVRVRDLEDAHGLNPGSLCARLDCVARRVSRLQFERLLQEDPVFIEESRQQNRERLRLQQAQRVVKREAARIERERRAFVAKAEILAHAPAEDAHPVDVMEWALPAILAFGGDRRPVVRNILKDAGADYEDEIRHASDMIGSYRRVDDDEFLDSLVQRAAHARNQLAPLHRILHNRSPKRLKELQQQGLKTAGKLAVLEEAEALLRNNPQLVKRWERQDEDDARKRARKRERRRQKAAQMQAWREEWARVLGIPVEKIPAQMSRPTHKGVQQMLAHRPRWAQG
jgi:hypothetical protein